MNKLLASIASLLLVASAGPAGAENLVFEGSIATNRTVVHIPITLGAPLSGVRIWTDSFQNGGNFDPITALWRDGRRLGENDDNPTLMPGQSYWDSGLEFVSLEAGSYVITIANFYNFSRSDQLADGFRFDDPGAVDELAYCDSLGACSGNFWRVNLADGFVSPVPEPSRPLMFLAGAVLLSTALRRRLARA